MAFQLTEEQAEIVRYVREETGNLGVIARAGTGKTSTIVEMAGATVANSVLCLAFNKAIADEMRERLPAKCDSSTLNSLGHRAWGFFLKQRLNVDSAKNGRLVARELQKVDRQELNSWDREIRAELPRIVASGKTMGFLPAGIPDTEPVCTEDVFFNSIELVLNDRQQEVVVAASRASWVEALEGTIDFDDQILCPTVHREASFKPYPITFVDEAQDLSILNHRMIEKIVRNNRLVIVGDPFQAIYAFRGAEEDSMYILMDKFNMEERKLTVSFRCDESIIRNVWWRAPDMQWRDDAPMGEVHSMESWGERNIPDLSSIICRNNAPLLGAFINLLQAGRKPALGNKDAIYRLIRILESLGDARTPQEAALERIEDWERKSRSIRREDDEDAQNSIMDDGQCLRAVVGMFQTIGPAIAFLQDSAKRKGNIMLSTIHKSKGLEFDKVFILDADLIRPDGQDPNVRYVAETRAKHELVYIQSDGFTTTLNEDDIVKAEAAAPVARAVACPHCGVELSTADEISRHIAQLEGTIGVLRVAQNSIELSGELVPA